MRVRQTFPLRFLRSPLPRDVFMTFNSSFLTAEKHIFVLHHLRFEDADFHPGKNFSFFCFFSPRLTSAGVASEPGIFKGMTCSWCINQDPIIHTLGLVTYECYVQ